MQRLCYAKAPSVSPYATYYENRDELTKLVGNPHLKHLNRIDVGNLETCKKYLYNSKNDIKLNKRKIVPH
jgi:lipoate-protein ligase A